MATAAHYLAHHLIVTGVLAVVLWVGWRLARPAPQAAESASIHQGDGGFVVVAVAAGLGLWLYLSHHRHPVPRAVPRPTVTHVIVQHVTGHASGMPGWAVPVMVITGICGAVAVAINMRPRGE